MLDKNEIIEILSSYIAEYEDTHCSFEVIYPHDIPDITKTIIEKSDKDNKELIRKFTATKIVISSYKCGEHKRYIKALDNILQILKGDNQ